MRVELREATKVEKQGGRIVGHSGDKLIEAEVDTSTNNFLGPDILRWRDMDFVFDGIEDGKAIYVRATGRTINWYPEPEDDPFRG